MKKIKAILLVAVVGLVCSCSKSDFVGPMRLQDSPHKKDTTINNTIPRIPTKNN